MKTKTFVWVVAAFLAAGTISACKESEGALENLPDNVKEQAGKDNGEGKNGGKKQPESGGGEELSQTEYNYVVRTFKTTGETQPGGQAEHTLTFEGYKPATVEVLVVAGGGGGGLSDNADRYAGGGGAGGLIYVQEYPISTDTITVKVGAGGVKASTTEPYDSGGDVVGGKGGNSEFGGIIANGGGGGASLGDATNPDGADGGGGGSGGGATKFGYPSATDAGTVPDGISAIKRGNVGGDTTDENFPNSGSGGGGAGGAGGCPTKDKEGALGGIGVKYDISGAEQWYAGGGAGGAAAPQGWSSAPNYPEAYGAVGGADGDADTGDGGSGGGVAGKLSGGNGGSGIVIVRWKAPKTE